MNYQQVDQLIAIYGSKLPYEALGTLREKLLGMDYNTASIYLAQSKDPTIAIILSVLVGSLGIDRIYIGDVVIGILKLITCGGCGIWWLIDLFLISWEQQERKTSKKYWEFTFKSNKLLTEGFTQSEAFFV